MTFVLGDCPIAATSERLIASRIHSSWQETIETGVGSTCSHCSHSQNVECDESWCSALLFHYILPKPPVHRMVPLMFRIGPPTWVNPTKTIPPTWPDTCFHSGSNYPRVYNQHWPPQDENVPSVMFSNNGYLLFRNSYGSGIWIWLIPLAPGSL